MKPDSTEVRSKKRPYHFGVATLAAATMLVAGPAVAGADALTQVERVVLNPALAEAAVGDETAPSVPSDVKAEMLPSGKLLVTWSGSFDADSGVKEYYVYANGAYRTWTVGNQVEIDGGSKTKVQVRALDWAGNRSARSAEVTSSNSEPDVEDLTAPSVPSDVTAEVLPSGKLLVTWSGSFDADSGVREYYVYADGSYRTWTARNKVEIDGVAGTEVQVRAFDWAGNRSARSVEVTATGSKPDVVDVTAPTTPTNVNAEEPWAGTVKVYWNASTDAGSGIQSYLIYVNGSYEKWTTSTRVFLDSPAAGSTIEVRAVDKAGNRSARSAPVSIEWYDGGPPAAPVKVKALVDQDNNVLLHWVPSVENDNGVVMGVEYYADGKYLGSVDTTSVHIPDAGHYKTFQVKAYDREGNRSAFSEAATIIERCTLLVGCD